MTTIWTPRLLSILRIVAGLLFLQHGTSKLLGFPPSPMPMGPFNLFSMVGVSGLLEFAGGILLVLGLFTRITAFILSGEMAVAYFGVHLGLFMGKINSPFPMINKGEIAVLYCFVFLYFVAAGAGPGRSTRYAGARPDFPVAATRAYAFAFFPLSS